MNARFFSFFPREKRSPCFKATLELKNRCLQRDSGPWSEVHLHRNRKISEDKKSDLKNLLLFFPLIRVVFHQAFYCTMHNHFWQGENGISWGERGGRGAQPPRPEVYPLPRLSFPTLTVRNVDAADLCILHAGTC